MLRLLLFSCAFIAVTADCPEDYFQCSVGGKCVPQVWTCDGHADCRNGSDELNCMYIIDTNPVIKLLFTLSDRFGMSNY